MKQANVPQSQSDQVIQQQTQMEIFTGYVALIYMTDWETIVLVNGYSDSSNATSIRFHFPPNDPKYLAEFRRAQDNPDYRVRVWNDGDAYSPKIMFFNITNPKAIAANAATGLAAGLVTDNTSST